MERQAVRFFVPQFFVFFLIFVVPALYAAARALASPRLFSGPVSAALGILPYLFPQFVL